MHCTWFRECFRQVHMDFHMPEFPANAIRNFEPVQFVNNLVHGKVNLVTLFAKDHFGNSFYNTQVGHKHQGLEADFLGATAAECRKRGIRTLGYYSLCVDKRAYDENLDWRYVDDKSETHAGVFGSVCMNTPYKDELALPQIEEIVRNYPVDGLFIDIPVPWGASDYFCMCESCRKRWKNEFNIDITPDLDPLTRQKLSWRIVETWMTQVQDIIRRHAPEMVLCSNFLGTPTATKRAKEICHIGVWESQPQPGDYLGHSFSCRTSRNDILDVQIMTVRFYEGWGDMSLKPAAQLKTELASIIGNGMTPNVGDQVNIDGTLQAPVYDVFNDAFGMVEQYENHIRDAKSVIHTAVLLPAPDPQLPMNAGAMLMGKADDWKGSVPAWRGAHKMLIESHLQTDLIYSQLTVDLDNYPVIVLPEPATYQPGMNDQLREYVANGGTLIAVGNSIFENGDCPLADVFGLRYIEPLSFSMAHFRPMEGVIGDTLDIPLQVKGQCYKVVAEDAAVLAELWYPAGETQPPVKGFRHPCPPPAGTASPYPFATVNSFGKGKAIYVAAGIFEIYWQTNHHWLRQFMEALIRHVDTEQPYQIDASSRIEANLMQTGEDYLLNLIHYCLGHQGGQSAIAGIERVDPVHNIECHVRCSRVSAVLVEPSGDSVPFTVTDGVCSFTVPEIEYLTMIRLVNGAKK